MDTPLFHIPSPYDLPKLKLLPLREQPAYRVAQNASACNLTELLAAIIGGQNQIEIAEELLRRFGDLRGLHQAHLSEIGAVRGIGQQTAVRLKAALALSGKLDQACPERPYIHSPSEAAALVQPEMSLLEQEYLKALLLDPGRFLRLVVTSPLKLPCNFRPKKRKTSWQADFRMACSNRSGRTASKLVRSLNIRSVETSHWSATQ